MRSQVRSYVNLAFNIIGDLATDLKFVRNSASSFNFALGSPEMSTPITTFIKGVVEQAKKEDSATYSLKVLCKNTDVPDVTIFDYIEIDNVKYNIVHPAETDGYTTEIKATKEVT